jgi:hypothetical protein
MLPLVSRGAERRVAQHISRKGQIESTLARELSSDF